LSGLQGGKQLSRRMKSFGEVIAEARKRRSLTLKAVAARVLKDDGKPMSQPYLNDIELGHRGPPSDGMIRQLARVLGVELDVLRFYANRVCEISLLISIRSSGSFTRRMFWASQDLRLVRRYCASWSSFSPESADRCQP
jgi:transcriptional regulator with XRE-family HTH domain